jgi:hypothetical protein
LPVVSCQLNQDSSLREEWQGLQWPTANDQSLPTVLKERLKHFRAATSKYSAANLYPMIQLGMIQHLHHRAHRPGFGIVRPVDQAPDPGKHHGAGAHRTRFNCNKQLAVCQTVVPDCCASLAQGHDLGVGCGIKIGDVAIPSAPNNAAFAHDHRSNRNFTCLQCALRRPQSLRHPQLV